MRAKTEMTLAERIDALPKDQAHMLQGLSQHGVWSDGGGWIYSNRSTTIRLLNALVKKGMAREVDPQVDTHWGGNARWYPSDEVAEHFAAIYNARLAARDAARREQEAEVQRQRAEADAVKAAKALLIERHADEYADILQRERGLRLLTRPDVTDG
jgi:hypothetical protein